MNSSWKKISRVYTSKRYQKLKKGKIEVIKKMVDEKYSKQLTYTQKN